MKKLLSGLLIGAFVFGIGAVDIQPACAASVEKVKDTLKNHNGDNSNRPKLSTDDNGKPMAPPNHNGDNSNRQ